MTYRAVAPGYPQRRSPDATARLVCLVIGVVAVLVCASFAAFRSATHESTPAASGQTREQLLADFPVPAGAVRTSVPGTLLAYLAKDSGGEVVNAYPRLLNGRGDTWALKPVRDGSGEITGFTGPISQTDGGPVGLTLSVLTGYYTRPQHTGDSLIEVTG